MLFTDLPLFRATDPETSRQIKPLKVGSHRAILLTQYYYATLGLTDEEAGARAVLEGHDIKGYWKRCSELRARGFIAPTGVTRLSSAGSAMQVCAITAEGRKALA